MVSRTRASKSPHRQATKTRIKSRPPLTCRAETAGNPCRKRLTGWVWLCCEHAKEYQESYERYKAASVSAEYLRDIIMVWADKAAITVMRTLVEVNNAIKMTETYIECAEEELRGRELHTLIFFAHVEPDPGHVQRTRHVETCIQHAYNILDDLRTRVADLTPPEPRPRMTRNQRRKQKARALREGPVELPGILCASISIGPYIDEDEESPLASGMDKEEWLADLRTEREAEEMLRWYAEQGNSEEEDEELDPMGPFVASLVDHLLRLGLAHRI
ncbi:hypothetical protein L226DRAFT_616783 [Lentinus tigrinus ALCF2SS1-7]|uniref:Uncharacterized protein n=1 Tax=Lentinus tigrinus ALCF2SS1-6 TaxID=1328759 RepID=A0A5C2SAW8_9APHY|nr:hypothetical protein L227DRAFT_97091 [Lentinus tigrinus ALCF2SS1-6]RPD69544.1 hypothetical protein L226DRAFT_616783 [Lentinus tigrinus ALCF2SS1-7]